MACHEACWLQPQPSETGIFTHDELDSACGQEENYFFITFMGLELFKLHMLYDELCAH